MLAKGSGGRVTLQPIHKYTKYVTGVKNIAGVVKYINVSFL